MNLLTDAEKTSLELAIKDVHDTFSRDIYMFKKAEVVYIEQNPSGFNFAYPASSEISGYIEDYGVFRGRVAYVDRYASQPINFRPVDVADDIMRGTVRLRLDASGAAFIKGCNSVTIDNESYQVTSDERKHGLFNPTWTDFFLKKSA